jgi:hypothetical protein
MTQHTKKKVKKTTKAVTRGAKGYHRMPDGSIMKNGKHNIAKQRKKY